MMEFNASRGSFIQPQYKEQLAQLAHIFCMAMDTWMSYRHINGNDEPGEANYCKDLWPVVKVLFTDMGMTEFRQLGGEL